MKKFSVIDLDYKFKLEFERPLWHSKKWLNKKVRRIMDNFPNYNMYWKDEFTLIVNIYFDNTGWDKDIENRSVTTELRDNVFIMKWEDD